jgi:hypothetical protein
MRGQRSRLVLAWILLVAGVARGQPAPRPGASGGEDRSRSQEARAEFARGLGFSEGGNLDRALESFLRSRQLQASKGNTLNSAFCLDRLGRSDEALELYEEAAASFGASFDEEDRRSVPAAIARIRGLVGLLEISADVPARVLVDGRERGLVPRSAPLRLLPGEHRLRLVRDGYATFEITIRVAPGKTSRVDAHLVALSESGGLRVEAPGVEGAEVFVDGVRVGEAPWEGLLAPGPHAVWVSAGDRGSTPSLVTVIRWQTSLVQPRVGLLGPVQRVTASPSSARISLGDAPLGVGSWQGRLPLGEHAIVASEEAYLPATYPLRVTSQEAADPVLLVLKPDLDHPRWPRPERGQIVVELAAGGLLGGSLHGSASRDCRPSCPQASLTTGTLSRLVLSYRTRRGGSLGLSGGYLALGSESERSRVSAHGGVPGATVLHEVTDRPRLRAWMLGLHAGQDMPLGGPWALRSRLTAGFLLASVSNPLTVVDRSAIDAAAAQVDGAGLTQRSVPLLVLPELGLRFGQGGWSVALWLGALFVPTSGPLFQDRGVSSVRAPCDRREPGSVRCAADWGGLRGERAFDPFAMLLGSLGASREF